MARSITGAMQSALVADPLRICVLANIDLYPSGTLRLASINRDILFGPNTYLGNGWLRPFSAIRESATVRANGTTITLGGLDQTAVATVLTSLKQGKYGILYLGLLDSSLALIADPIQIFHGRFDTAEIVDDGETSRIDISYESEFIRLNRIEEARYTDQWQKSIYSDDRGFEYASQAADWSGFWGRAAKPKFIRRRKVGRS